jgi:hypothetical protein
MSEEKVDPKPTPRISGGSVKKDTPAPKPLVDFRLPSEEQWDQAVANKTAPAPKVQPIVAPKPVKPVVGGGEGFRKKEPVVNISTEQKALLVKASKDAQQSFNESVRVVTPEEVTGRETELAGIVGKDLDAQNLFTATKDGYGSTVSFGKGKIESSDQLQAILDDPLERSQFYNEKKNDLARYFNVASEKDFDDKLAGGLSAYEKNQFSNRNTIGGTIYDPVFNRKAIGINEQGYRSEFNQFAPDPVSEKYQISQRRYQALQQFNKLRANNIASDAYGQPFEKPEDFYSYLQNPVNRDAYQRKNKTTLKQIGYQGVNDLLKTVFIESILGADLSRQQDFRKMRVAKGTDVVEDGVIGKGGTLFDENPNSSSIAGVSETDLGKVLFENDLGNSVNIDIPDSKRLSGFNSINQKSLVAMLEKQGLGDDEIDEVLGKYRAAYERTLSDEAYEKNREKMGYYIDPSGKRVSKYDQVKEQRALGELDEDERKIAGLYDQIRAIYSQGKKIKGKQNMELGPEQLAKINSFKAQITQIKRNSGFFGFNAIPEQEFFSPDGKRLEGEDQKKAQTTFVNTMQGEQKTDLAILKEKRNILYEQVDNLQKRLDKFKGTQFTQGFKAVLPEDYDVDKLNADFEAAQGKNTPWFMSIAKTALPMFGQGSEIQYNDQYKANYIYLRNLADKIVDRKAQLKAINKLVYTNADLTKIDATGVWSNLGNTISKNIAEVYTGSPYLTPADEVSQAASFLQENGLYVNPEVVESLKGLQEDKVTAEGLISSLGVALQMGLYRKPVSGAIEKAFTSETAVATRSYMASRYGRTGIGAFRLFEKAAVQYGIPFATYEISNQDGTAGIAEELGMQSFDKVTGILKLGKFVPNNIIGKMFTILGRSVTGAMGSFVEETAANVWTEFKANGFDIRAAVEDAYGKTEDERLMNMRMTAFSCVVFSTGNLSNLGILFKTKQKFQTFLDAQYGENVSETDREILDLLDQTIKNTRGSDDEETGNKMAMSPSLAVAGRGNTTAMPLDQPFVMSTGPVEPDQKTTTSSAASSGAGSEGVKVEKRTGNLGEEFYVSSKNGVLDNKVVYRYNSETGELEAKGLTSTTDEFVPLNIKTRDFIEGQSQEHGIVSKDQAENIATQNVEARKQSQAKNESGEPVDQNKVSYQQATDTSRRKKERIDKAEASANTRYNTAFNEAAQARNGLFTGISEEVKADDDNVKAVASEISRNMGGKMKINLTSFFQDGKALVTDLVRKKFAKVGDYMAPLFKDFDKTFFNTEDFDLNTEESVNTRQTDAIPDKVRESVSRNSLFNQVFGTMVSEGRMSKEDAVDNFIINLLQNSNDKVKEVFGNDKSGLENFVKLRKDFNKFVANKYTGANTFSTTNKFVRNTPMTTGTTKNRKADLKKEAAQLVQEEVKRKEVKSVLKSTQEEGAFVTEDQIDAVLYKNGDITANEFLENIGKKQPITASSTDVTKVADAEANSMVNFDKYQKGNELIVKNEKTRDIYRKQLRKQAGEVWGFAPSLKTLFKTKRARAERKAYVELYIRGIEECATRASMSLEVFMESQLTILKRTNEQFVNFLTLSPDLVPLYQAASNYSPEAIAVNLEKAGDLKDKGYTPRQIELMTGLTFDEAGDVSIAANNVSVDFTPDFTQKLFKIASVVNKNFAQKPQGKVNKILGRFNLAGVAMEPSNQSVKTVTGLFDLIKGNEQLLAEYPDLSQVNVRFIQDNTSASISFSPNLLYTGKGKGYNRPGDILINLNQFLSSPTEKSLTDSLEGSNRLAFESAIRKAIQHTEGEFDGKEMDDVTSPSTVRSKLLEATKSRAIDQDSADMINKVLDFYIDKAVFQYSNYQSLFLDVAQILYRSTNSYTLDKHFEKLATDYGLTESDIQSLKGIFKEYTDKSKADGKPYSNTFTFALKLGGLSNSKLIDFDFAASFSNKGNYNQSPISNQKTFGKEEVFTNLELVDTIPSMLENISKILSNPLVKKAGVSEELSSFVGLVTKLNEELKSNKISPNSISSLLNLFSSPEGDSLFTFVDNVANVYGVDEIDEYGNYSGQTYMEPEDFDVDFSILQSQMNDLSEQALESTNKIEELSSSRNVKSDTEDSQVVVAKEIYYQMFPGIDTYKNGIYDPFKKVEDFTKQELKDILVGGGLVTEAKFEGVYSNYQALGKMDGSVASNFIGKSDLSDKQMSELNNFNKLKNSLFKNFGTAFYSNADFAVAQVVASQKRFPAKDLQKILEAKGAKATELTWLGFDEFIQERKNNFVATNPGANPEDAQITRQELVDWASNIPTIVSYNPNEETQVRGVDSVTLLSPESAVSAEAGKAYEAAVPFSLNSDRLQSPDFYKSETQNYNAAVKFSDGSVRVFNLNDISIDNLEVFKNYVGTDEYNKFKDTITNIEKLKSEIRTNPNSKDLIKNYIKLYVQAEDELKRSKAFKGAVSPKYQSTIYYTFSSYKPDFGEAAVPNTYREHLVTVPLSKNPVFKDYNDKILDALEQLNALTETPEQANNPNNKQKIDQLTAQFNALVTKRNALGRDMYNSTHFTSSPNEVIGHIRTEIVYDEDGNPCLFVHEMQSDKSQEVQEKIKTERDRLLVDFAGENYLGLKNKVSYNTSFANEAINLLTKERNKIEVALGKPILTAAELAELKAKNSTEGTVNKLVPILAEYSKTFRESNIQAFKDFDVEMNANEKIKQFKSTTPLLSTESFMDMLIKQSVKIASDNGLSKVIFTGGSRIGPQVAPEQKAESKTIKGINSTYNDKIPSRLEKLSKKMGYTMGTSKVSGDPVELDLTKEIIVNPSIKAEIKLENGQTVKITDEPIQLGLLPEDIREKALLKYTGDQYLPNNLFHSIELSNTTHQTVAEGTALYQDNEAGAHGAFLKSTSGKNMIFALTNPNISTAMHELSHMFEQYMTASEKQVFMDEIGHTEWSKDTSEKFARGFEKYLYDGKGPNSSMTKLFENFKKWMLRIYDGIVGTPIEMKISQPMREIYNAMLGETTVNSVKQRKSTDVFDDIGSFINDLKANPQFQGITDDEIYTALMRSGFESSDVQDYFSLKQRANILKQQQKGGIFKQEADLIQDETEAMRVVRDQKALIDEIENIDPAEYPIILQTLFDAVEDGDVPLAKAIQELIAAKHSGSNPDVIAKQYSQILKAGTSIGRMLQLFRQLTKDTYISSAEGMFARNEKKGMNIPEGAKDKIRTLATELDRLKELYKQSRDIASSDPFGTSKADPNKTNLEYNVDLYKQMQEATERFVDARMPFEGDDSLTDMYRSFIKGGLMTPGSLSVNTLSNVTKFITGVFVDPLKSGFSWTAYKLGITEKQNTKTSLKDWAAGIRYGMPLGIKRAYKILKDGTMTQSYNNPESYVQGYSFYKSFVKFFGLKLDHIKRAAGYIDDSSEELALKHGFKVNMEGKIPYKQQAIAALQGLIGPVPDVIFRAMGATDAVFRDFAYFSAVSEQFKMTEQSDKYIQAIKNAKTPEDKKNLRAEYDAMRKAYITINSDFKNSVANEEAMRYVYSNDNLTTDLISQIQGITRTSNSSNSVFAKLARLAGTGIVPFTRIPSNYAVELMEFFVPEYALAKIGVNGYRAYNRSSKMAKGENLSPEEMAGQRTRDSRDVDRVLARALVGTGLQFVALHMVKGGAISGAPSDENEEDKGKSMSYNYAFERPYSINLSLVKERFKEMFTDYKSTRNDLWDKENDLIIDYRALGVFGAALYMQFKESKQAEKDTMKYINRGTLEQTAEDFAFNVFGNWGSAGSYIIDQTFVRGLMSSMKAITDEDENKLPSFLADFVLTLSSGLVPNSTAWMDKWRREYMVDYDAKEAPAFKMFGMKVESTPSTLFWTKLATKMAERWPFGDATKFVDLPFVEASQEYMPIKVDAFGKEVIQTPTGSVFGSFLYNTFDVFKVTRAYAGYETPDWEALVYLAVKKGDNWESLPSLLPRRIATPSGSYKFAPDEYNNLLRYNAMLRRDMVQKYIIDSKIYKELIDPNSQINKDAQTKKPVTGVKNPNVLIGFEVLGQVLSDIYNAADQITNVTTYTFVDAEREKIFREDPDRYVEMLKSEMLSPMGQVQKQIYGGQETGQTNIVKSQKDSPYFNINYELIKDPNRFKAFAKGAMEKFKQFNSDPRTLIISAQNEADNIVEKGTDMRRQGLTPVPLDGGAVKSPLVNKVIQQKQKAAEVETKNISRPGLTPVPLGE